MIDLTPTLLEAAGVPVPESMKGHSFLPPIRDVEARQAWPDQHPLHPTVKLLAAFGLKPDFLAGCDKPADRFQTQLFSVVHADVHMPA
jgi:hypothetical protein